MNVDSLSRLIESADVATLRNIAVDFLPLVGFDNTQFSDGPYDGGLDFVVRTQRVSGRRIGFQLSVEKKWQGKIAADAATSRRKHNVDTLYFITSRRVPAGSWTPIQAAIAKSDGVSVFKFDSQAIATEFIRANAVGRLLEIFGITINVDPADTHFLGPRHEAVASLLTFGSDARDFRDGMIDSMIKATLAQAGEASRGDLIEAVLRDAGLNRAHGAAVNSGVDRLLQSLSVVSRNKILSLSEEAHATFAGLRQASQFELGALREEVRAHLKEKDFSNAEHELILSNLLDLVAAIVSDEFSVSGVTSRKNEIYQVVLDVVASRAGKEDALSNFADLATVVAKSQFGRRVAAAHLHQCLLQSNSRMLTSALGGDRGLSIWFDTSVFIPVLCSALFDPDRDRFGKSGSDLLELLKEHEFSPYLPSPYLEEVASHLVNACRDYRHLLDQGVEIQRSTNAFVSHYSSLKSSVGNESLTFSSYVSVFGIDLAVAANAQDDSAFFRARDRAMTEFRRISRKYGFETVTCEPQHFARVKQRLEEVMGKAKSPLLVSHDAKVASYLESQAAANDDVLVLCSWDRAHADINPHGESGYFVMSPVALIDFLLIGKRGGEFGEISSLNNFIEAVSEKQVVLGANIWDAIARVSGTELSDGRLIAEARRFREDYMSKHAAIGLVNEDDIAKSWIAWRKATASDGGLA